MAVAYNFKRGIDAPSWQWLSFHPQGVSNPGTSNCYDGKRYMYWIVQSGTTAAGTASTTQLWRYCTWTNGWQLLTAITSGNQGMDIEYDPTRNCLYIMHGAALTSWQVFNLNTTNIVIANTTCTPWNAVTVGVVLPATAGVGASITLPTDKDVIPQIDTGIVDTTGNTTSVIKATDATGTFALGMVGLQVRITSGTLSGTRGVITAVTDKNTFTVSPALSSPLVAGVTFVIEQVEDTATAGTVSTLVDGTAAWTVNMYANMDVIITGGTGAGQRRRIASNTATTLTLAATVTGNANTGNFATAPAAGSTFKIVPSGDFLYYQNGGNNGTFYKLDVSQTGTAPTWTTLAAAPAGLQGGANTMFPGSYAPYSIVAVRGNGTTNLYHYNIGLNTWSTYTTFWGQETLNTGASVSMMHGQRKLFIQKDGQARCYTHDFLTGQLEPAGVMPYANPVAYDGKRSRYVVTPDGVQWIYVLRAGGQEFYRMPVEWL